MSTTLDISHYDFSKERTNGQSHRNLVCWGCLEIHNFNRCQHSDSQVLSQEEAQSSASSSKSLHPTAALLILKPILKVLLLKTKADSLTTRTQWRNRKEGGEGDIRNGSLWKANKLLKLAFFFYNLHGSISICQQSVNWNQHQHFLPQACGPLLKGKYLCQVLQTCGRIARCIPLSILAGCMHIDRERSSILSQNIHRRWLRRLVIRYKLGVNVETSETKLHLFRRDT